MDSEEIKKTTAEAEATAEMLKSFKWVVLFKTVVFPLLLLVMLFKIFSRREKEEKSIWPWC